MTLAELVELLRGYADAELSLDAVHARLLPVLAADSLDITASDETRWVADADAERLFWRLAYHLEAETDDAPVLRRLAGRVATCYDSTASAATTHELLPVLFDQERLCTVVERSARGIVSRTSFLSFVAESGYPDHVKLWLQHASASALGRLSEHLSAGRYEVVVAELDAPPG